MAPLGRGFMGVGKMSAKKSKWFAKGHGHARWYDGSDTVLLDWNGKPDGAARYIPHVRRYTRNGAEYPSLAALFRAIENEHAQ